MYCRNCGKEIDDKAVMCPHCAYMLAPITPPRVPNHEREGYVMNATAGALLLYNIFQFFIVFFVIFILAMGVSIANNGDSYTVDYLMNSPTTNQTFESLATIAGTVLGTILIVSIIKKRLHITLPSLKKVNMSFKRILYYTILGIGLSAIASYGVGILDYLLSFIGLHMSTPDFTMRYDVFNNILLVIATCIAAPIFEELLFRGLILKSLKRFGNMFAIIITSLLFGLAHGNLPQSIPTFFMSLVLCYVVLRSDSLLPAIAIHFINNLIGMIQLYLQDVAYMQLVYLAFDLLIILITSVVLYKKRVQIKTYIQTHKGAPLLSYFTRLAPIAYLSFSLLMIIATLFIKL